MSPETGERRVKAIQKDFLSYMEKHPLFYEMTPDEFNEMRKCMIRGTFTAYRIGVIGRTGSSPMLWDLFFEWLDAPGTAQLLTPKAREDLGERCLVAALESYKVGVLVSQYREE